MYGADLGRLRAASALFDIHFTHDWRSLRLAAEVAVRGIFWMGPDRDRTLAEVMDVVGPAIDALVSDLEFVATLLSDGIRRQDHASRLPR